MATTVALGSANTDSDRSLPKLHSRHRSPPPLTIRLPFSVQLLQLAFQCPSSPLLRPPARY
ncbi:hypothetical protein HanRHA438_Chr09g0382231 [Helianthus annuus]|uniref:Uncharacterized protein n=1 Tax=Helianthus annuus TaxID=4232 RepID=A0A9K3I3J4_HELAN|nr:hypothetical protein HanXRQr2_Chr09g0370631 [Helianthus annuus]KAJ0886679.1 hypothetical protein HanRHA438_Chr09g0382231 [Helianthus annuus]KAJ0891695.1 hypothetical protein HanPSC8_Chr09g0357071 [Helianthus annuus]